MSRQAPVIHDNPTRDCVKSFYEIEKRGPENSGRNSLTEVGRLHKIKAEINPVSWEKKLWPFAKRYQKESRIIIRKKERWFRWLQIIFALSPAKFRTFSFFLSRLFSILINFFSLGYLPKIKSAEVSDE